MENKFKISLVVCIIILVASVCGILWFWMSLNQANSEIQALTTKVNSKNSEIKNLEENINTKNSEIQALEIKVNNLQTNNTDLQSQFSVATEKNQLEN